jgi:hypothetical protein
MAAWPSSAPYCRSTPAPAPLFLGGGALRWRPGSRGRSAASPLFGTHTRLTFAGFLFSLSLSQTQQTGATAQSRRDGREEAVPHGAGAGRGKHRAARLQQLQGSSGLAVVRPGHPGTEARYPGRPLPRTWMPLRMKSDRVNAPSFPIHAPSALCTVVAARARKDRRACMARKTRAATPPQARACACGSTCRHALRQHKEG